MKDTGTIAIIFVLINLISWIFIRHFEPIIFSIIIISSGLITITHPKIMYDPRLTSILTIRIGSLIILIYGIGVLIFTQFSGIIPPIIFDYASKILHIIIDCPRFTTVYSPKETIILLWELLFLIGFIIMAGISESSVPDVISSLRIRNNMESFIYILIIISVGGAFLCFLIICIFGFMISLYIMIIILSYIYFFVGFLIIICPNAIDDIRTKDSGLRTKIGGIMCILAAITNYIPIIFNIDLNIFTFSLIGVPSILLFICGVMFYCCPWDFTKIKNMF